MISVPKIDRRLIANFDWLMLGLTVLIALIGVATIYSATRPVGDDPHANFYMKQLAWGGISLLFVFLIAGVDYRWFHRLAYPLLGVGVVLLAIVLVMGRTGLGAQRWLSIGPLSFQPSEVAKLFFILAMARALSEYNARLGLKDIARLFGVFLAPSLVFLLLQPDLGTGLMFLFTFTGLLLAAGIKRRALIALALSISLAIPFLGGVFWAGLKPYQRNRIVAFLDPDIDPAGIGYQIAQSKITIGSGGMTGKGFQKGTQGALRFLPERHTDFIFSIYSEEWGFAGAIALLLLYLMVLMRGLDTANRAKDRFGYFLALGAVLMVSFYLSVNIGMTLGLTPVVGVPLPFMSYGGTALLTNFTAVALLINVRMRRFELFY
ncbi:MAG: rod shape-determining protein RodA [Nitrospirae bacterium]|nr:rod shape-determining protein RodA [Nitrospirota bacterium]